MNEHETVEYSETSDEEETSEDMPRPRKYEDKPRPRNNDRSDEEIETDIGQRENGKARVRSDEETETDIGQGESRKNRPSGENIQIPNNRVETEIDQNNPVGTRTDRNQRDTRGQRNVGRQYDNNTENRICVYWRRGYCWMEQQCKFKHPSMCQKAYDYGHYHYLGCKGGRECNKPHPEMCRDFQRTRYCSQGMKCKYYHPRAI